MKTDIKAAMKKAIDMAISQGAEQADVIVSRGESFSVNAQNAEVDKYKVSGSQVLGIRTIKDDRVGLSYTEFLDDEALKIAAKKSLENAEVSEPRPFEKITTKDFEGIQKSEYQADETSTQEKIDFVLELESKVKEKDSRISAVPYNGLSEVNSESYYLNSLNCFTFDSEYYLSCYTSALIKEGSANSMHYQGTLARKFGELDAKFCIDESVEHATRWLKAESLPTKAYDIIFDADAFSDFFGCFGGIFSGKGAMDKINPFQDKMGQLVMSEEISIQDIPLYKEAFFKSHYDSEGFAQEDLSLVENGILKNFYHNTATANYLKQTANGRAAKGAKSALGVSGTTKVFSPGKTAVSELKAGEYLEVVSMQGLHSGADSYSGEFSFAASGYLCRDGERIRPIKGVTISGNFYKMMENLKIVGNSVIPTSSKDFFAPQMRFEGVSVGGE